MQYLLYPTGAYMWRRTRVAPVAEEHVWSRDTLDVSLATIFMRSPFHLGLGTLVHHAGPTSAARPSTTNGPNTSSTLADDIVMVWSGGGGTSAASLWITYLQSCFVEICRKRGRPSFR